MLRMARQSSRAWHSPLVQQVEGVAAAPAIGDPRSPRRTGPANVSEPACEECVDRKEHEPDDEQDRSQHQPADEHPGVRPRVHAGDFTFKGRCRLEPAGADGLGQRMSGSTYKRTVTFSLAIGRYCPLRAVISIPRRVGGCSYSSRKAVRQALPPVRAPPGGVVGYLCPARGGPPMNTTTTRLVGAVTLAVAAAALAIAIVSLFAGWMRQAWR